ncbi:MAG: DUF927 domain-containing protein [Clostridiales bacterium]|nr:DUF927 domain-containing protein [Clostridiales bacterium]
MKAEIIEKPKQEFDFTFADFTETTKPFDYIAQFKDDEFIFMQMLEIVNKKANSCGIRNFKSLFKKYMEKTYPKEKSVYVNSTEFSGQELELNCGIYFCDDSGVSYDDGKSTYNIEVCNHPIMPIQRLVNIDDNTEKLKLAYRKGVKWREIIIDKETLASSNKILSLAKYGVAVNSETAKYLVKFFTDIENLNFDVIEELNSVGRLGWINGKGFSPYVDDLVFDGSENFRAFFNSVHPQGEYSKWLELCMQIRKSENSKVARIMLAAAFSSVLVELCDCLPFFVHLWGGTEAGKTVGLMLAASVWANPSMGDYIHTFNSTNVAQELSASFVNSLPLIIDELQIIKEKNNFDNIIYTLSEGVGRARGQRSGGLQKVGTWKNSILTNGEYPISSSTSGSGAVNRIIEIDCKDVKLFNDPVHVVDVIKRNYGGAGRLFVEYLQLDGIPEKIKSRQKAIYQELLQNSDTTEKQAISASLILLADELTEEIIFEDGIRLNADDLKPYLSTKAQIDQNKRCLDFIYDYITINSTKFNFDADYQGEIWGVKEYDTIYIIKSVFDKILRDNGYNSTAFLSWAKSNKIVIGDKGHNTVLKRIKGSRCRCVALVAEEYFYTEEMSEDNDDLPFD